MQSYTVTSVTWFSTVTSTQNVSACFGVYMRSIQIDVVDLFSGNLIYNIIFLKDKFIVLFTKDVPLSSERFTYTC